MTESIFKKAVDEAKNRNYERAADLFTLSLNQQSNNYAGYLNRGTIKLSIKAFEEAVLDFSTAISLEPFEITAYYNRFIAHYRIGNKVQALKDLYAALSLSYTKRGQELQIIKFLNKAINLVQNNVLAYLKRGNLYQKQGNYAVAQNDYTGALQYDQNYLPALSARASLYKIDNKQEEAQYDVQRIAQLTKQFQPAQIILQAKIAQFNQRQLQTDIKSKLKQFAALRSQIFRLPDVQTSPLSSQNTMNCLQVKRQTQNQNSLGIFHSFNESSHNGSTTPNITNKVLQQNQRSATNSKESSNNEIQSFHNSHITQQSQEYNIGSGSQFKKVKNQQNIQQQNIPQDLQFQQIQSINVAPYSKLDITVHSAILTRDTQLFGSMSPYVVCQYNGWVQNSDVCSKGGKTPQWNQSFTFNYVQSARKISFKIYDKQTFKQDDLVCETYIEIKHLLKSNELRLYHKKKQVGTLSVKSTMSAADEQ